MTCLTSGYDPPMTEMQFAAEDIAANDEDDAPEVHLGELLEAQGDDDADSV